MNRVTPAKYLAGQKNAPGGGVAAPSPTEGAQSTPASQEIVMTNPTPALPEIQIIGDGTHDTSHGTAHVWAENGTVNIALPDRSGTPGSMLNFTFDDAANIAAELNLVLDEEATR